MATLTINVRPAILSAEYDVFTTNDLVTLQNIEVLDNDYLGVEPTIISSINTTGFTLGSVIISSDNISIDFTPNGNIGTSQIKYIITDSIGRNSETSVIITTT